MTILAVGTGEQYSTIAAAVAASSSGDTVDVNAGTYNNDFPVISHDLTMNAVGGTVSLVATSAPPNGKGIIDEGGSGVNVSITGFDISGAMVPDGNGAGIRYEGGALTLSNDTIHGNQNGLLSNDDANGSITITGSTFADNGVGDGFTHNIYVNAIGNLTVKDSVITRAVVGHDIKSRAASTTIVNNLITDGSAGRASYQIDLPNGGTADIKGNIIQKGANAENPAAISYGEEGGVYGNSSLTVTGNTILNDFTAHSSVTLVNDTNATAAVSGNSLYGWTTVASGSANLSGNPILTIEPALSSLTPTGTITSTESNATSTGVAAAISSSPVATDPTNPGSAHDGSSATISTATVASSSGPASFLASGSNTGTQQDLSSASSALSEAATAVSSDPASSFPGWLNASHQTGGNHQWSSQNPSSGSGLSSLIDVSSQQRMTGVPADGSGAPILTCP